MKRGIWTREEDAKMLAYISKHGARNWSDIPKKAGLKRCGKSCRLRWTNYLRPDLNHDNFSTQEEELIIKLHAAIGSRWSIIAQQLPGRTDNDVKNYWNTRLRKKLSEMGIDPITHKPFSQIIEDYGNIGGFGRPGTRIGHLKLKHASFVSKIEDYSTQIEVVPNISNHLEPDISSLNNFILDRNIKNNSNRTCDLFGSLQAMELKTNATSFNQYNITSLDFLKEDSYWSSTTTSSSSTCSTAAQETSSLTWRNYLVDDEFLPTDHDHQQEQEINALPFISNNSMEQVQNVTPEVQKGNAIHKSFTITSNFPVPKNGFQGPSSSNNSFIDAILDKDNESFLCFPNLLEEPFYS